MVTDRQRKLLYWLVKLRVFRIEMGLFRTPNVVARRGFRWLKERLLRIQVVDSLWHAPACPANHFHKRRFVFQPCSCGSAIEAQLIKIGKRTGQTVEARHE